MITEQRFACVTSTAEQLPVAIQDCFAQLRTLVSSPRWLMVFTSQYPLESIDRLIPQFYAEFPDCLITGCHSSGAIGLTREFETQPALIVWAALASDLVPQAYHLQYQRTREGASFLSTPPDFLEPDPADVWVALSDPFTFPMDIYLGRLNEDHPGLRVVGGHASGGDQPGGSRLFLNDRVINHGAVVVAIKSARPHCLVVSQGCRPIGKPLVVTAAERNQIFKLGGKPALEQLLELFRLLPTQEQKQVRNGLHLGLAVDEYRDSFQYGDFLIRNVLQLGEEQQSIVIGDFVRVGQTVQFHIRDENSAHQDLGDELRRLRASNEPVPPLAALVFTCNGRGSNFFSNPDHDAGAIAGEFGKLAVAGMFAAGEFGPVGGANHLHGFTASVLFLW